MKKAGSMMNPVTLADIQQAFALIRNKIIHTPCTYSQTLSNITGAKVYLKFENLQYTASFKDRGTLVKLLSLSEKEKLKGVIAMSAGNHAQAVAYHAQQLKIPATIVMPRFTPNVKVECTQAFGAEVILHGLSLEESAQKAIQIAKQKKLSLIHPYDDPHIIAGHGTIVLEMLQSYPDLEYLIVPVGGGGLISGMAIAAKALSPQIKVIGVQTQQVPSMLEAMKGKMIKYSTSTMAEGIAVKKPGLLTRKIIKKYVDKISLVSEPNIEKAILLLLEIEKTIVEGAGAVPLALLLKNRNKFQGKKVGLVLSGGNIDLSTLSVIIQRGLVKSGRLVRLHVEISDDPGALARVTQLLGELNANIVEVHHQRAFTNLSVKSADVEIVLQSRGIKHMRHILKKLKEAQYKAVLPDNDIIHVQKK